MENACFWAKHTFVFSWAFKGFLGLMQRLSLVVLTSHDLSLVFTVNLWIKWWFFIDFTKYRINVKHVMATSIDPRIVWMWKLLSLLSLWVSDETCVIYSQKLKGFCLSFAHSSDSWACSSGFPILGSGPPGGSQGLQKGVAEAHVRLKTNFFSIGKAKIIIKYHK